MIGRGPEENSENTGTSRPNERERCHSERMKLVLLQIKGNLYKDGIDVFFTWSNRAYVRIIIKVSGDICLFSFFLSNHANIAHVLLNSCTKAG